MIKTAVLLSLTLMTASAGSSELVNVPGGQIEAIWLSPVSKKDQKRTKKQIAKIKALQAMKYAVTIGEFKVFLDANPNWTKEKAPKLFTDLYYLANLKESTELDQKTPVTYVSWFAARAYCQSVGMRLPTVNEWEYMAAASETKADANRDPAFLERILKWYGEPQGSKISPVGSIYRNKYGLWDMHGLIWELVEDFNSTFVTGESREDGSFNKEMFCGAGSMSSSDKENYASFMRFAFRSSMKGRNSVWNLGFRCVK